MKIGQFAPGIFVGGGVATYIRRIGAALSAAGHEVVYFDLEAYRNAYPQPDVTVNYLPDAGALYPRASCMGLDILHLHAEFAPEIERTLPTIRTVHGHQPYCPSTTRFLMRSQTACPRAYHPLGCLWGHFVDRCGSVRPQALQNDYRRIRQERETLPALPILTVSDFLKREMIRSGYPANRIAALRLPAPEAPEAAPHSLSEEARFLFVGRLVPHKGAAWLLRALAAMRHPVALDIAGEGEQEAELRALAQRLQVADRVRFHGWVNAEKVADLMQACRAVVFPSLWHEPAGFVTLEAGMAGRAVLASRVGGLPEYAQPDRNALVVAPNDTRELAAALDRLVEEKALAAQLGEQGRYMAAAEFKLTAHLEALLQQYERAIASGGVVDDGCGEVAQL